MPRARAFNHQVTIEHYRSGPEGERELVGTTRTAANVQSTRAGEQTVNQDQQWEQFNLYLPAGTEMAGADVVIFGGLRLEAEGAARDTFDFGGRPHHAEAVLRRVE